MTYREVIYMVNDLCKQFSDDASYTEDHILFLINKYRGALLQQYLSVKKQVPHSNYQTIEIDLLSDYPRHKYTEDVYLKTTKLC